MSELGSDFSGVQDIDYSLSIVSGRLALSQAIARRWLTRTSELFYDPDYGAGVIANVNALMVDPNSVAVKLEIEALKDERIETASVDVTFVQATGALTITGKLTDEDGPFTLTLKAAAMTSSATTPAVQLFLQEAP